MDAFDARFTFLSLLNNSLSSSKSSIASATSFAYEQFEHFEELYNCLSGEITSSSDKNAAFNLIYLLDSIVMNGRKIKKHAYIKELQKDLPNLLEALLSRYKSEDFLVFLRKILSQWRKKDILTIEQILAMESKFPTLGSIEVTMSGSSIAMVVQTIEKDREKQRKAREDWWKESDDFTSMLRYAKSLDVARANRILLDSAESGSTDSVVLESIPVKDRERVMSVYVWDLEKTIIQYNSLFNREFSNFMKYDKEKERKCLEIGNNLKRMIYRFCDDHMFYRELEFFNDYHSLMFQREDDGRDLCRYRFDRDDLSAYYKKCQRSEFRRERAFRYREIRGFYEQPGVMSDMLTPGDLSFHLDLVKSYNEITQNWTIEAGKTIRYLQKQPNVHCILLSSSPLIPTISKLFFYQIQDLFPNLEHVYSGNGTSKTWVMQKITQKYPTNCRFTIVGGNQEMQRIASQAGHRYIEVRRKTDLEEFYWDTVLEHCS